MATMAPKLKHCRLRFEIGWIKAKKKPEKIENEKHHYKYWYANKYDCMCNASKANHSFWKIVDNSVHNHIEKKIAETEKYQLQQKCSRQANKTVRDVKKNQCVRSECESWCTLWRYRKISELWWIRSLLRQFRDYLHLFSRNNIMIKYKNSPKNNRKSTTAKAVDLMSFISWLTFEINAESCDCLQIPSDLNRREFYGAVDACVWESFARSRHSICSFSFPALRVNVIQQSSGNSFNSSHKHITISFQKNHQPSLYGRHWLTYL